MAEYPAYHSSFGAVSELTPCPNTDGPQLTTPTRANRLSSRKIFTTNRKVKTADRIQDHVSGGRVRLSGISRVLSGGRCARSQAHKSTLCRWYATVRTAAVSRNLRITASFAIGAHCQHAVARPRLEVRPSLDSRIRRVHQSARLRLE